MRSVLITGGAGFLGTALARRLLEQELVSVHLGPQAPGSKQWRPMWDRVCIYSRGEHRQAAMRREFAEKGNPRLRWFIGDVRDQERLSRAMRGVDLVIHAASLKRIELGYYAPDEMIKTNIVGTMNVVEAAANAPYGMGQAIHPRKVLLVSSDKAFQPVSPYGQSKALAESLVLAANNVHPHGPRYAVVRYGNVWRSTGSVVPTWAAAIAAGDPLNVTDEDCTRFYMTLDQACDLVLDTAAAMKGGELVIPTLPAYRVGDLLEAMGAAVFNRTGLPTWEKMHESMDEERSSKNARRMTVNELKEALR